jgi:hypothetical protein
MSVYFITARQVGMVKIGCAYEPFKRLADLQGGSPVELVLEGVRKGAYREEREFHARFAALRVRGEWFTLSAELESVIAESDKPTRAVTIADKRRLAQMGESANDDRWEQRQREKAERALAAADITFPFRAKAAA